MGKRSLSGKTAAAAPPRNPLELSAALIFAVLFVVISFASAWVKTQFGQVGIYWLAAVVGVTDIDPFVLSIAQGGAKGLEPAALTTAILIAASSNNFLKSVYSIVFSGWRASVPVVVSLVVLSLIGIGVALL